MPRAAAGGRGGGIRRARDGAGKKAGKAVVVLKRDRYPSNICSLCLGTDIAAPSCKPEILITCYACGASGHPSCLQFTPALTERVQHYKWACIECKVCEVCTTPGNDDELLFCDGCDRGYHTYCVGKDGIPEDDWSCDLCVPKKTSKQTPTSKAIAAKKQQQGTPRIRFTLSKKAKRPRRDESDEGEDSEIAAEDDDSPGEDAEVAEEPARTKRSLPLRLRRPSPAAASLISQIAAHLSSSRGPPSAATARSAAERVRFVCFGAHRIGAAYVSPYPEENRRETMYVCEWCFSYTHSELSEQRHRLKCTRTTPPGDEIYRQGDISVFEVEGRRAVLYCQGLCLFAKMFLDHKTLLFDVEPFVFYIMTTRDERGHHFVGYFSKERYPSVHNVNCIVVLPLFRGRGYGQWLIDFSYLLTRVEGIHGTPEKPLSELGALSYRSYWRYRVASWFLARPAGSDSSVPLQQLLDETGLLEEDALETLGGLRWTTLTPAPGAKGSLAVNVDMAAAAQLVSEYERKNPMRVDERCLYWSPIVTS